MAGMDDTSGGHGGTTRRRVLQQIVGLGAGAALAGAVAEPARAVERVLQSSWRYCWRCRGLFYNGHQGTGVCTGGLGHDASLSRDYYLDYGPWPGERWQMGWRHCINCQGLAYGVANPGVCFAGGGPHDHTGSYLYMLRDYVNPPVNWQSNWFHCKNCQGLHYRNRPDLSSVCPAGGLRHTVVGSLIYLLDMR
jgi:hypothetical protein